MPEQQISPGSPLGESRAVAVRSAVGAAPAEAERRPSRAPPAPQKAEKRPDPDEKG